MVRRYAVGVPDSSASRNRRGVRARRQQQLVVRQRLPRGDLLRGQVQARHGGGQPQVDVVLGVPGGVVHEGVGDRVVAQQIALGERGSLVRRMGLRPDQDQSTVVALLAKLGDGRSAGQAGSDDDDGHGGPLVVERQAGGRSAPAVDTLAASPACRVPPFHGTATAEQIRRRCHRRQGGAASETRADEEQRVDRAQHQQHPAGNEHGDDQGDDGQHDRGRPGRAAADGRRCGVGTGVGVGSWADRRSAAAARLR